MSLVSRWTQVLFFLSLPCFLVPVLSTATPGQALSVTPSTNWYGDDGTWSAISIRVGTPAQWLDVMVSTVSSETWVVGIYGCLDNNTICTSQRGGVFDLTKSSSWVEEGLFELGVDAQLGNTGYAEYGLDDLTFGSTGVTIPKAIIGSLNTTEYWLGYFGLGIVPGNFNNISPLSAISSLVEVDAVIPSHSYGFTAGATYQQKGETLSLTLGGYDANRFVPHNISFELNPSQTPQAYINSISVSSAASSNNWTTPIQLLNTADRVSAIIDSSTPYLWFPQSVCDRFAEALGLTYNDTLNLYTFDGNASQHDVLGNSELSFTFTLSDIQSSGDDVNITLPYEAFDLQLTFPAIPGTAYGAPNSSKYYFPLRQATNEAQYTIGRAFLQEAYLITDYERNTFSVHQAVHIANPIGNTSIVSIPRFSSTNLSGPPTTSSSKKGLSNGAIAGIVVGVAAVIALLSFALLTIWRRRKRPETPDEKATPKPRLLDRFRRRRQPFVHEATGSSSYPTEVGADATHERFELPAPLGPAELDSESGTISGTTETGSTQDSVNISAYERARRKLERQQNAASSPSNTISEAEKSVNDISPVAHYRADDVESPLVSPVGGDSGGSHGSLTISGSGAPSPISPAFGMAAKGPLSPPPTYRRMVEPGNVVYAGRLPSNVQLPSVVPKVVGRDGRTIGTEPTDPGTATSLGSLYTEHEEERNMQEYAQDFDEDLYGVGTTSRVVGVERGVGRVVREEDENKFLKEDILAMRADMRTREIMEGAPRTGRLDGEDDLVHVPQVAEHRFSWEEERVEGTD